VGVPLGFLASNGSSTSVKKDNMQANASAPPSAPAPAGGKSAAAGEGNASGTSAASGGNSDAALAVCDPSDVTVALRREAGAGALLVTSRGPSCRIARVPSLQWPSGSTTFGTEQRSSPDRPGPADFGVLPADGTASATVQWTGCGLPDGTVVYVDWGKGPVAVNVAAAPSPSDCGKTPAPTKSALRVSPLTGLS